jgi:hypothetical protein
MDSEIRESEVGKGSRLDSYSKPGLHIEDQCCGAPRPRVLDPRQAQADRSIRCPWACGTLIGDTFMNTEANITLGGAKFVGEAS